MMLSELVRSINARLILGEKLIAEEKSEVVNLILASRDLDRLLSAVDSKSNMMNVGQQTPLYPSLFLPSDEERAAGLHLVTGELPKTRLLSDNAYELEVLRLLALWGRGQQIVQAVLEIAEKLLLQACFFGFCSKGECPGASLALLRFWTAYRPEDVEKQIEIIQKLRTFTHVNDKGQGAWVKGQGVPKFYLWSTLSECADEAIQEELLFWECLLSNLLPRPWLNEPFTLIRKHVIKNILSRIPAYQYISGTRFYLASDGRWHATVGGEHVS